MAYLPRRLRKQDHRQYVLTTTERITREHAEMIRAEWKRAVRTKSLIILANGMTVTRIR